MEDSATLVMEIGRIFAVRIELWLRIISTSLKSAIALSANEMIHTHAIRVPQIGELIPDEAEFPNQNVESSSHVNGIHA